MHNDVQKVLGRVLKLGGLLTLAIALMGSLIGYLVAGLSGIYAAMSGTSAAFVFTGLTVLSVYFGSRMGLGGLMALVLGGWVLKMVLFMVLFAYLNNADWLTNAARPIVFFTVVGAVIGGLVLDGWIVAKSKLAPQVNLP